MTFTAPNINPNQSCVYIDYATMKVSTKSVATSCLKGTCACTKTGDYNGAFAIMFSSLFGVAFSGIVFLILTIW